MSSLESKAAARSSKIVAVLSDRWRVIDAPADWEPQWLLQRREGRSRARSDGWAARSYCVTRASLQRCVREYCGEVSEAGLRAIEALPEKHPRRRV